MDTDNSSNIVSGQMEDANFCTCTETTTICKQTANSNLHTVQACYLIHEIKYIESILFL